MAVVAVPDFNPDMSTTGSLLTVGTFPFTTLMNFLKAKSNILILTFSKSSSSCCPGI